MEEMFGGVSMENKEYVEDPLEKVWQRFLLKVQPGVASIGGVTINR